MLVTSNLGAPDSERRSSASNPQFLTLLRRAGLLARLLPLSSLISVLQVYQKNDFGPTMSGSGTLLTSNWGYNWINCSIKKSFLFSFCHFFCDQVSCAKVTLISGDFNAMNALRIITLPPGTLTPPVEVIPGLTQDCPTRPTATCHRLGLTLLLLLLCLSWLSLLQLFLSLLRLFLPRLFKLLCIPFSEL